jgi:hypothetical protein
MGISLKKGIDLQVYFIVYTINVELHYVKMFERRRCLMRTIRAIVVDPTVEGRLKIGDVESPRPALS